MSRPGLIFVPFRTAQERVRDSDLLLFRRRGLISIAGRGDHSHAAKAAFWHGDLVDWRPGAWNEAPPQATAIEPAADTCYSAEQAALFLRGFNGAMLPASEPLWAVAVPVTLRFEGDVTVGASVRGHVFEQD